MLLSWHLDYGDPELFWWSFSVATKLTQANYIQLVFGFSKICLIRSGTGRQTASPRLIARVHSVANALRCHAEKGIFVISLGSIHIYFYFKFFLRLRWMHSMLLCPPFFFPVV